jgi:predicted metalloprotease with PDZ domain
VDVSRPIEVRVDAREAPRRLLRATLTIPVRPGPLTLSYPKWIQGEHAPNGPIADLAGLTIRAGTRTIPWQRDDVDLHAFHLIVPDGTDAVDVALEYLSPAAKETESFTSASATPRLAMVHWYTVVVYPGGKSVRDISIRARLTVPDEWKVGTALPVESTSGTTTTFQSVSLETLADSPALCGKHFREIPLGTRSGAPHSLVIACDSAEGLKAEPELVENYRRLVSEAHALFGAHHYRSYRFLMTLSDQLRHNAVEHHECSDNRLPERFFLDDTYRKQWTAWVLAHEYVHSWNGKYRRPEGLATPDFQRPMRTRLLWVYEGLTEYLGFVLAARSGLYTPELSQENFALIADWAKHQGGRTWRPLADTTVSAPFLYGARGDWQSRRRGVDFYDEGALLWLDADTLVREKTDGKKSLDDFCKAFYGGGDTTPEVKPYVFEDIVAALNDVVAHDWKGFLERRLNTAGAEPPLNGLARGGWKLVYRDTPGDLLKARDDDDKSVDLRGTLGLIVKDDGGVVDVIPGSPADRAGVGPSMKVLAVNDRRMSGERLRHAVAATKGGGKIALLLENGDYFQTAVLDYSGGARYPHLERVSSAPDRLGDIFRPRAGK